MAATKLIFVTQPINTTQGFTLQGAAYDSVNLRENHGIRVAAVDANNVVDTTYQNSITVSIGTNPSSGVLSGTLTKAAVNGIATFSDLAITLGGVGYTLSASDGTLTNGTSNAFTLATVSLINPAEVTGTIITTGGLVGPYRYRPGSNLKDVFWNITSTNITDSFTVVGCTPGAVLGTNNSITLGTGTCPSAGAIGIESPMDIYVKGNTVTGTITANLYGVQSAARV